MGFVIINGQPVHTSFLAEAHELPADAAKILNENFNELAMTTTPPPIPREELVEKLEAWAFSVETQADALSRYEKEANAVINPADMAKCYRRDSDLLRATLAELKRGEEDSAILDFLDKHMLSLNHTRASCCVYMDGTTVQGQVENVNRHRGGGSFTKVKGPSIRDAIRPAMSSTAAKEGEG